MHSMKKFERNVKTHTRLLRANMRNTRGYDGWTARVLSGTAMCSATSAIRLLTPVSTVAADTQVECDAAQDDEKYGPKQLHSEAPGQVGSLNLSQEYGRRKVRQVLQRNRLHE